MAETFAGYRLLETLGSGGMGEVHRARRGDEPEVALKVLTAFSDSHAAGRLLREGEILTRIRHPNVVSVHEIGISQGRPFVAMELLVGQPLSRLLTERGPLPARMARHVARGIAAGLCSAHAAGILHRDVKPSNVIVTNDGRPVVVDFGIARDTGNEARLTQAGATVGSPLYYSPEQSRGEDLDARSDVYQFGLVLFEILTGVRPFAHLDPMPALVRRLKQGVPPVLTAHPEADPRLAAVADLCLKPERLERPFCFDEVLSHIGSDTGPAAPGEIARPAAPAAAQPAGTPEALGCYRIVRPLGHGAMGQVFLVHKGDDPTPLALKVVFPHLAEQPGMLDRFRREIQVARKLVHPALVRFVDDGQDRSIAYYVMEYVEGETLADRLASKRPKPDEALSILADLASGLAAMHAVGLVHRDLKPANIILTPSGRSKVMDFGMAKGLAATTLTRTGQVVGTPAFFPPEYEMVGAYDQRSDLYQLGLILHEMVTGSRGFPTYSRVGSIEELRSAAPVVPPRELAIPEQAFMGEVYRRLLAPDPRDRYEDARELDKVLQGGPRGRPASRAQPARAHPAPPGDSPAASRAGSAQSAASSAREGGRRHGPPLRTAGDRPEGLPNLSSGSSKESGWTHGLLRAGSALAAIVKYGLVALTLAISLAMIWAIPSLIHRIGAP